jgi:hypothetical protein
MSRGRCDGSPPYTVGASRSQPVSYLSTLPEVWLSLGAAVKTLQRQLHQVPWLSLPTSACPEARRCCALANRVLAWLQPQPS